MKVLVLLFLPFFIYAQQEPNVTSVKNKQRAILINNFAQQIGWDNINEINYFTIGVLGSDPVIKDLKIIAEKRKIHGKPVSVKKISSISAIKNISLLYVHEKFNFDIDKILRKVSKKNILIISENYRFNESMVNIINTEESFQYELNSFKIQDESFIISPNLLKNAITTESKWLELYRESQNYLNTEKQRVAKQKEVIQEKDQVLQEQKKINSKQIQEIKTQKEIIVKQFENINKKEGSLEKLKIDKNEQNQEFKQKLALLDSLEKFIKVQEKHIKQQEKTITSKEAYLEKQLSKINDQEKTLAVQKNELNTKKNQVYVALILAGLAMLIGFIIFRSNRLKKRLNKELSIKNIAIEQKTKALKIQNMEMEQFAYIASHDLQEPLNTITSFIQLIKEQYSESMDDIGRQSLTYIGEASVRMKVLITSLLEYSRLGKKQDLELIDTYYTLVNLKSDLKELITKSNTKFSIGKLPKVYANKVELRLLFQNLITNGIKFMPKDRVPKIEIFSKKITETNIQGEKTDFWKFTVTDNGIGIKQEHISKIFAIFQRLHNSEEFKGTGIGLAHCKKIVESLNGQIGVVSEENNGSTFWFTIPVLQQKTN